MARKISRKDGISLRKHAEKTREEFESAAFYEKLLKDMMRVRGTENKELKKDDICLYFDVWREPYRIRDKNVSETFTEIIIGKVENSNPLTLSEVVCLNTYQDSITYSKGTFTWSRGSMVSPFELIRIDNKNFQKLNEALKISRWKTNISYDRRHITTFVRNLENFFTQESNIKKGEKEKATPASIQEKPFERATFYEPLVDILQIQEKLGNKELKKDDICLYFDVWREPYRIRDKNVSETFTEIIIGKVENSNPLNFSEALSLDTYHDRVAYSTGRVTWSGGSMISTRQLIPVDYELFQRLKIALKTRNWEKEFSYDRRHITTFVRNLENFFNGRYPGKNYRVVKKQVLVGEANRLNAIISLEVEAPEIAAEARPGQFLVIRLHERGERIPLTIADIKKDEGSVRIIFQVVGKTTEELATLKEGDLILDLLGPLGNPVEIRKYDKPVICVAGGVGVASIYAKTKALKEKGNYVISIIGAKSKEILILEEEMRKVSDEIYITTDDGSYRFTKDGTECLHRVRKDGFKIYGAFVDSVLEALFSKYKLLSRENDRIKEPDKKFLDYGPRQMVGRYSVEDIEEIIAVGPIRMMWAVVNLVAGNGKYRPEREYKEGLIKTLVSLNPIMVDGTGLCGCCRTRIYNPEAKDYATKFACVDGPVFNGLLVDFESLLRRTGQYKTKEQKSVKYLEVTGW